MAEQTLSLHVKSKIKNSSSQPQNIPRNEDNLSLLRESKIESTEIRCGPIHTPRTDRYFKERQIDPVKTPHASAEDQDLNATQKNPVEKDNNLSMKDARTLKRDSQEYESVDVNNYNYSAQSDSISTSILSSPQLNFMTRDTSTARINVSIASTAAHPFDDGRCVRAALLEELKTYEDLLKINGNATNSSSATHPNLKQVASLLDYPHKGKLDLKDLNLTCKDIPVIAICHIWDRLNKLVLKGNKLSTVPPQLVLDLHALQTLDLQQCGLTKLPSKWNLGSLRRLIVSHNKLQDFLEEDALRGLPQLRHLDFYDNNLHELILPMSKNQVLTKLEYLNLGFNQLDRLPEELTLLTSLRVLKVPNNLIEYVPEFITHMKNLHKLEVTSNPIVQPPLEDCERGICAMRRYYRGLGASSSSSCITQGSAINYSDLYYRFLGVSCSPCRASDNQTSAVDGSDFITPPVCRSLGEKIINKLFPFALTGKKRKKHKRVSKSKISFASSIRRGWAARQQNAAVITPSHDLKLQGSIHDEEKLDNFLRSEILEQEHTAEVMPLNDTLKIIFVGMAYTGKTSLIRRLKYGNKATIPRHEERTIGVDVYDWDPAQSDEHTAQSHEILDTSIIGERGKIPNTSVKFSVWDFAGQHVYHVSRTFDLDSSVILVIS
jgi:Leucine-rich repeat (LRR) protein